MVLEGDGVRSAARKGQHPQLRLAGQQGGQQHLHCRECGLQILQGDVLELGIICAREFSRGQSTRSKVQTSLTAQSVGELQHKRVRQGSQLEGELAEGAIGCERAGQRNQRARLVGLVDVETYVGVSEEEK